MRTLSDWGILGKHSVILSICKEQELIYLFLLMLLTCNQFQKKPSEMQQVRVLSSLAHWPVSLTVFIKGTAALVLSKDSNHS